MSQTPDSMAGGPPAHVALLQMLTAKWLSTAISTAAILGIADHVAVDQPVTVADLAAATKTNESALYRLLRALSSVGIFSELEDGRFAHTPLSVPLRSDAKPCVRNMAMMLMEDWHLKVWAEMPWSVQTGQPAPLKVYGMRGFDYFSAHPEAGVVFNHAMTDMSTAEAPLVAAAYDFSGFTHIIDVAGGLGMLLASILEKTPGLRGTVFEMPYFIEQVRSSPILAPYTDRCDVVGGDFFVSVPPADCYIMKHIIHDWEDEKAVAILENCRASIEPGGKLLVVERVVGARNVPQFAKLMDLEMLVAPGGLERTEDEFRALFKAAGFRLDRVIAGVGPQEIIEGSPV